MNQEPNELLLQALETEIGGVQVYQTALKCVVNEDLKEEWEEYLEQTNRHVEVMRELFEKLGLDPEQETPGRTVVRHIGESLVIAMKMALKSGKPEAAELVACECVVNTPKKPREKKLTHSKKLVKKSKIRKMNIFTIVKAGAVNYGLLHSECRQCCRLRKKRKT
jgi:rubrerythrin